MTRQKFEPNEDFTGLGLWESPTFGPVTSRLNVHFVVDQPAGPATVVLETSIDGVHWDSARAPDGVSLMPVSLNASKIQQYAVFGRLFRIRGANNGTAGTLIKVLIFHD